MFGVEDNHHIHPQREQFMRGLVGGIGLLGAGRKHLKKGIFMWQPIETAPKGIDVLLCMEGFPPCAGYFDEDIKSWVDFCTGSEEYVQAFKDSGSEYYPTHWMPMPEGVDPCA